MARTRTPSIAIVDAELPLYCGRNRVSYVPDKDKMISEPLYIYKLDGKTCYWATLDDLRAYGLTPLKRTLAEWDEVFVGAIWNASIPFLTVPFDLPEYKGELQPLDKFGLIPQWDREQ